MENDQLEQATAELLNKLRDSLLKDQDTGEYLDPEKRADNLIMIFEKIDEMSQASFLVPDLGKRTIMYYANDEIVKEMGSFLNEHNQLLAEGK